MNSLSKPSLSSERLRRTTSLMESLRTELLDDELGYSLAELQHQVAQLRSAVSLLKKANDLGLEMAYPNRQDALHEFMPYLEQYVRKPDSELYIVGSSLKGVLAKEPRFEQVLHDAMPPPRPEGGAGTSDGRASNDRSKTLCVLLTHPWYTRFRENQEERGQGDIADEVFKSIRDLKRWGEQCPVEVRLYKGTPTCFLIATTEMMLLNPYPYEKEAFQSFCLTVKNAGHSDSIYNQYFTHHFLEPWENRRGNTLDYKQFLLEGPNPGQYLEDGPDFFVVQDARDFYLGVFLKGRNGLPPSVDIHPETVSSQDSADTCAVSVDGPGPRRVLTLGDEFRVKLLRMPPDGRCAWEDFRGDPSFFNTDQRRGKVLGVHPGRFEEFSMVGVFSADPAVNNPHQHNPGMCRPELIDQPLPLFWKSLGGLKAVKSLRSV
jgi:hypothetical protein